MDPARAALPRDVQELLTADFQDSLATAMLLQDGQGRFVQMNRAAASMLGGEIDELIGHSFAEARWNAVREDGTPVPDAEKPSLHTLFTGEPCYDVVLGIDNPGRPRRWLSVSTYPVAPRGEVVGVLSSFVDVSALVSREHMLRILLEVSRVVLAAEDEADSLQRLCDVLVEHGHYELAWVGVVDLEAEDRVEIVASAGAVDYLFEGMVTWRGTQASGRGPFGKALRSGRVEVSNDLLTFGGFEPWRERAREFGFNSSAAIPFRPGGRDAVISVYDRHQRAFDEVEVRGFEEIAREVEFLIASLATRGRVAAVEQANAAKSYFLSRMSHELRTPLNAILGFAQLLSSREESEVREMAGIIATAGRHLLDLVNDVLDVSRVESGQMAISLQPVELAAVAHEAVLLTQPHAGDRAIEVREGATGSLWAHADPQRLRQVLVNLLSNALKFSPADQPVQVELSRRDDTVRVAVIDHGPGIDPQLQTRLFQPFDRLDADERGIEGTGLGLVLCAALVEAMGGSIEVASALGVGSSFTVVLTAGREAPGPADLPPAPVAEGQAVGLVLHVEDDPSNRRLVERILARRPGIELMSAPDGASALARAALRPPDLVLLDLHLPDMAGGEVLARLRAGPSTREVPVVVLSADASTTTSSRLLRAGAAEYLAKPVDVNRLLALLDATLAPGR